VAGQGGFAAPATARRPNLVHLVLGGTHVARPASRAGRLGLVYFRHGSAFGLGLKKTGGQSGFNRHSWGNEHPVFFIDGEAEIRVLQRLLQHRRHRLRLYLQRYEEAVDGYGVKIEPALRLGFYLAGKLLEGQVYKIAAHCFFARLPVAAKAPQRE